MCYSSLNDPAVMDEDYPIPPKAAFRDDMRDEPVDDEAWANLQRLREKKDIHTIPRLHDAYLACDVLLLADIIENNRKAFKEVLGLDLLRFLTMPKASWYGALYRTGAEIELVTEQQLADDIEAGLRGGLSCPFQPMATANDPRTSTYDPAQPPSIITYNDATNLYGYCMQQYLPYKDYAAMRGDYDQILEDLRANFRPDDDTGLPPGRGPPLPDQRPRHGPAAHREGRDRRLRQAVLLAGGPEGIRGEPAAADVVPARGRAGDEGAPHLVLPAGALPPRPPDPPRRHAGAGHHRVPEGRLQDRQRVAVRVHAREQGGPPGRGAHHGPVQVGAERGEELLPRRPGLGPVRGR
jgi:hypothetical protein